MEKIEKLNRVAALLALLTITTLFSTSATATLLLNVDFGVGTSSLKTGIAAVGIGGGDYWNLYTRDNGSGGYRSYGVVTNLKQPDLTVTTVGLTVSNAAGAWQIGSTDPMYSVYLYPVTSGVVTAMVTNLPVGSYDFYLYSPDGRYQVVSGSINYGVKSNWDGATSGALIWQEGVQYSRFHNVGVTNSGQAVVITVQAGVSGKALISGMQIVQISGGGATPPIIISQPTNQTVSLGGNASFGVAATGVQPFSFQWYYNTNAQLVGATNAALTLPNVQMTNAGSYSVRVTDASGTAVSANAVLAVFNGITNALLNVDFGVGTNSLKTGTAVVGVGAGDFWNLYTRDNGSGGYRTYGAVTNLKQADLTVTTVGLSVANAPGAWMIGSADPMYAVYVYPTSGGAVTATMTNLPVGTYDFYLYSPDGKYQVVSGSVNYGVKSNWDGATGGLPVWQEGVQYARFQNVWVTNSGQPVVITVQSGVSGSALISGVQIVQTSGAGNMPPTIITQPTNQTVNVGSNAIFSVSAMGTGTLYYQWQKFGTAINGEISANLSLLNVAASDAGNYNVIITNAYGSATSSVAVLAVGKAAATVTLSNLSQTYDGTAKPVSVTTAPLGLSVSLTYNGSADAPTNVGNYTVIGTINDQNYQGGTTNTLVISASAGDVGHFMFAASPSSVYDGFHNNPALRGTNVNVGFLWGTGTALVTSIQPSVPTNATSMNQTWSVTAAWNAILSDPNYRLATNSGTGQVVVQQSNSTGGWGYNGSTSFGVSGTSPDTVYSLYVIGWDANYATPQAAATAHAAVGWSSLFSYTAVSVIGIPLTMTSAGLQRFGAAGPLDGPQTAAVTLSNLSQIYDGMAKCVTASTTPSGLVVNLTYNGSPNCPTNVGNYTVIGTINNVGYIGSATNTLVINAVATAPTIISQPTNMTVTLGETAGFSVSASGTAPLSYQWSLEGVGIPGATNTVLVLTNIQLAQAGNYSVLVENNSGSALSSNAYLTVNMPVCTNPPAGLAGWWPAENDAQDAIGGNGGTLHAVSFNMGKVGQSFDFNGTNAYIESPGSSANKFTNAFAVEAWINYRGIVNPGSEIVVKGLDAEQTMDWGLAIVVGSKKLRSMLTVGGGWYYFDGATVLTTGTWYHVAMVYDGLTNVKCYVNGVQDGSWTVAGQLRATDNALRIGAYAPVNGTTSKCWFNGKIDELSLYNRALSIQEIQKIYNAGVAGKCVVPTAPFITAQPQSNSVLESASATFAVSAGGTPPLSYQWRLNGVDISDATNRTLMLTNVQLSQAGNYSVMVSNASGLVISSNAALTVIPLPADIQIIGTNAMSGTSVAVPLQLVAKGNENAIGFSLNFNTQRLIYANAALGADVGGASLLLNTTEVSTGRLGIAVALASDTTFTAGTQQIATVTFISPVNTSTQSVSTTISFADTPVLRQVSDINAHTLAANYFSGNVTLLPTDLEGDVTPRLNGDRAVTITDWVQAGRFAALIDTPADGNEFQRADCAPRGTLGDGQIKVTDWVQAGRYAAGLDSPTAVGGPVAAVPASKSASLPKNGARQIQITNGTAIEGVTATFAVDLQSQGDESALGFSLEFDPAKFTYSSATKGSAAGSATLNVNTNQAASGKVGLAIGLPIGNSFPAGSCEIIRIALKPKNAAVGNASVGFADQPLSRSVSDSAANELSAIYVASTVTVNPLPTLNISVQGSNAILSWPLWAEGFDLQMSSNNAPMIGGWSNPTADIQTNGGNRLMQLPVSSEAQFFRLQHP